MYLLRVGNSILELFVIFVFRILGVVFIGVFVERFFFLNFWELLRE